MSRKTGATKTAAEQQTAADLPTNIVLWITQTAKGYNPRDKWQMIAEPERVVCKDMREARQYLREKYGKAKRVAMYRDSAGGERRVQTGYVIGFRNADYSHAPVQRWLQQDWIEFVESRPVALRVESTGSMCDSECKAGHSVDCDIRRVQAAGKAEVRQ